LTNLLINTADTFACCYSYDVYISLFMLVYSNTIQVIFTLLYYHWNWLNWLKH